jgi:ACS family tartrate transporter-like MFS transporter
MSEQQIFAKSAWRLLPLMTVLLIVNYVDRTNVGFAALTMNKDLGFTPEIFGFGAGILLIGYALFQVPANVILERLGTRRWIFCIMAAWGLLSASNAFVYSPTSFYLLRFLVGMAEAGLTPGMLYYLTLWFPSEYRTRFTAIYICALPLSGTIGAPLSALILEMDGIGGLHGWQWMFLLEGVPATTLALAVLKLLPDGPADAKWLNEAEKHAIAARLDAEPAQKKDLWTALRDPRVLALFLVGFANGFSQYGTGLWLPQIVNAMGFSTLATGLLVALCNAIAVVAVICVASSTDRRGERSRYGASSQLVAVAGYLAAILASGNVLTLLGLTLAVAGTMSAIAPFFTIAPTFLKGAAAAGGIALINTGVSLGGFVGPVVIGVLKGQSGDYASSMAMLAGVLMVSALILLALGRVMATAPTKAAVAA